MTEIDWTVTLYKLFLGDQDSVTGHYNRGYTIHTIEMAIFPQGSPHYMFNLGMHAGYNATGYTEYLVEEGDVVLDQLGHYYQVKLSPQRWGYGDQLKYLAVGLEEKPVFPFLSGFFGFEDLEHGLIGFEFEDGFERGYWAL